MVGWLIAAGYVFGAATVCALLMERLDDDFEAFLVFGTLLWPIAVIVLIGYYLGRAIARWLP